MDYEEFIWALNDTTSIPLLKKAYENKMSLGDDVNRRLIRDFRLYMLVGGMPQAVNEYLKTNNFRKVDLVKRDIISLYEDDFYKIDPTGRLSLLFNAIPSQLNSNSSRYQVSTVINNQRPEKILELISEMKSSQTVLVSYHANDPNIGLLANYDISKFKLFLCDTGLFTTLMFKDRDFTENDIYLRLLNDKLSVNLGYLYENIVAQTLVSNGNDLFYYTWLNNSSKHNYKIDFLLSRKNKLYPLEIKSFGYRTHTSIDEFCNEYPNRILNKYLIYTKDYSKDKDIIYLPIYFTQFI